MKTGTLRDTSPVICHLPRPRQWLLKLILAASAAVWVVYQVGWTGPHRVLLSPDSNRTAANYPDVDTCTAMFRLTDAWPFWDARPNPPGTCAASRLSRRATSTCLDRLRRRRGRPASVFFLGDSRARILFQRLTSTLSLQARGRTPQEVFPDVPNARAHVRGQPTLCAGGYRFKQGTYIRLDCDLNSDNDVLNATFRWCPWVDEQYLETLTSLERECRRSVHSCPDLVVLTSGMWYTKMQLNKFVGYQPYQERALVFRQDFAPLAPVLRKLARYTQLVYKLDGPEYLEGKGNKSRVGGAIMTINVMAMTVLEQVPGAVCWTTSLADTLWFYHSVCLRLTAAGLLHGQRVKYECLDENHEGVTVLSVGIDVLLSYLCRETHVRQPGRCCGTSDSQLV